MVKVSIITSMLMYMYIIHIKTISKNVSKYIVQRCIYVYACQEPDSWKLER